MNKFLQKLLEECLNEFVKNLQIQKIFYNNYTLILSFSWQLQNFIGFLGTRVKQNFFVRIKGGIFEGIYGNGLNKCQKQFCINLRAYFLFLSEYLRTQQLEKSVEVLSEDYLEKILKEFRREFSKQFQKTLTKKLAFDR